MDNKAGAVAVPVEDAPKKTTESSKAPEVQKRVLSLEELVTIGTKVETRDVPVPALGPGVHVKLRVLSAGEALKMREDLQGPAAKNAMLRMVLETALNADGTRMFTDISHLELVGRINLKAIMQLEEAGLELNDLLGEARKKALMEERKNASGKMEDGGSPSVLH